MTHFFILGNHPALSLAELFARLPISDFEYIAPDILLAKIDEPVEAGRFITSIGGLIKMGRIVGPLPAHHEPILEQSFAVLNEAPKSGKFNFGFSVYGPVPFDQKRFGLQLKTLLKAEGVSCRLVTSNDKTLSSVVVEQNKLNTSGRELVFIPGKKKLWLGVTEAVQPFKDLSSRDYGRPARDDRSGMLPPKLAQVMLNLCGAGEHDLIIDPFCGSGTILTEAMIMGFKKLAGSDNSPKALEDSRANIEWTAEHYAATRLPELSLSDAAQLSRQYKKGSAAAIVTETYLGPQRGAIDIVKVSREMGPFYAQVLDEIAKVLKPGGRAVVALPAFIENGQPALLNVQARGLKPVEFFPRTLNVQGVTRRSSFLYGRSGQRVWREIMVLTKAE